MHKGLPPPHHDVVLPNCVNCHCAAEFGILCVLLKAYFKMSNRLFAISSIIVSHYGSII